MRRMAGGAAAVGERLVDLRLATDAIVAVGAQRRFGVGQLERLHPLLGMGRRRRFVAVFAALGSLVHGASLNQGGVTLRALTGLLRRERARHERRTAEQEEQSRGEAEPASVHRGIIVPTAPSFATLSGCSHAAGVVPPDRVGRFPGDLETCVENTDVPRQACDGLRPNFGPPASAAASLC